MFWIDTQIPPCANGPSAVDIIAAVGAVATSLVTLYLVHRRILADREDRRHRDDETKVHEAVVKKLGLELAEAKLEPKPK